MTSSTDDALPTDEAAEIADSRLIPQLNMMAHALWASPVRNALFLLSVAVFAVIAATAYGQIQLNNWNQPFYDALSHRNVAQFEHQLGVFGVIAGILLVLNVAQKWLGETLKWRLRQGLVNDLVQNWLVPGRAFRLGNAGAIGVNPDQRMHEDARHLTELTTDLGLGLLQSSILLASFVEVLWNLSNNFAFHVNGKELVIPGYMVWAAVLYSGSASLVSYWVGRNLIDRNERRYAREADLRFSLVRVNEHIDHLPDLSRFGPQGRDDRLPRRDQDQAVAPSPVEQGRGRREAAVAGDVRRWPARHRGARQQHLHGRGEVQADSRSHGARSESRAVHPDLHQESPEADSPSCHTVTQVMCPPSRGKAWE
jgi:hypothetical protein